MTETTTHEERQREARKRVVAELEQRKQEFIAALSAELRSRGHEVKDGFDRHNRMDFILQVDGVNLSIRIDEQMSGGGWRMRGTGKLYVTFNCNPCIKGARGYMAPEGKKGFNVKKAADALVVQLDQRKRDDQEQAVKQERKNQANAVVQSIRDELDITEYSTPNVEVDRQGVLKMNMGNVTGEEAKALLKMLLELRKK